MADFFGRSGRAASPVNSHAPEERLQLGNSKGYANHQGVAALEAKVPLMQGTHSLELRIRSIPVSVASKAGYLFSSGSFDENDR